MSNFLGTVVFSLIMGASIFLSLPIVLRRKTSEQTTKLLEAVAIGILVFLIADVFSNVTPSLYKGGALYGYGADPRLSLVFAAALAIGFFMLYFLENRAKKRADLHDGCADDRHRHRPAEPHRGACFWRIFRNDGPLFRSFVGGPGGLQPAERDRGFSDSLAIHKHKFLR